MAQDKLPLKMEQMELLNQKRVNFGCSPFEIEVIKALRSFKFGQLTIHMHNGIPLRYTFGSSHVIDPTKNGELMNETFGEGKHFYGNEDTKNQ